MAERPRPQLRMPQRPTKRPEPAPAPIEDDIGQSAEEEAVEEQDEDKPQETELEPVVFEQPPKPAEDDPWAGWQPPEGFTPAAEPAPAEPLPPVDDSQLGLFEGEQHADPDQPEPVPAAPAPVMSSAGPLPATPNHHHRNLHPRTLAEMEAGRAAVAARRPKG